MTYLWQKQCEIETMLGCVFDKIEGAENGSDVIRFFENGKERFRMYHEQDCCETVELQDLAGDVSDLIGSPILEAECVTNSEDDPPEYHESFTWTFYKLSTIKGNVTLRWLGESNGYYSESVELVDMAK